MQQQERMPTNKQVSKGLEQVKLPHDLNINP